MAVRPLSEPESLAPRPVVPHYNRDPISSLRSWPVIVRVAGYDLTIPAMPATDWLLILMADAIDPDDVFPGLLSEDDREFVEDLLLAETITVQDLYDTCLDIISEVSARQWWIAMRLVYIARDSWDNLGAEMILTGIDADRISLAAWLDALTALMLKLMEPSKITMFTMQLEAPPVGEEESPEELEMSANAFLSMG